MDTHILALNEDMIRHILEFILPKPDRIFPDFLISVIRTVCSFQLTCTALYEISRDMLENQFWKLLIKRDCLLFESEWRAIEKQLKNKGFKACYAFASFSKPTKNLTQGKVSFQILFV